MAVEALPKQEVPVQQEATKELRLASLPSGHEPIDPAPALLEPIPLRAEDITSDEFTPIDSIYQALDIKADALISDSILPPEQQMTSGRRTELWEEFSQEARSVGIPDAPEFIHDQTRVGPHQQRARRANIMLAAQIFTNPQYDKELGVEIAGDSHVVFDLTDIDNIARADTMSAAD